jgi:FtsP/CotA-like multicopper oxidase with cupredoxin domain
MPHLPASQVDRRRHFVFSESDNGNRFFINGKQFSHHRIDVHAKLGDTEEWVIRNVSDELHPFHIHINDFEVISVNGRPYDARSLQDTVPLPVHGKVVIRQRFARFTGEFVYHCHILAHEDHGMMGVIKVSGTHASASGHAGHMAH